MLMHIMMENSMRSLFCLAVTVFALAGCGRKQLQPLEFMEYCARHSNELTEKRSGEQLLFETRYLPADVLAMREAGAEEGNFNAERFTQVRSDYEAAYYFNFKITTADGGEMRSYIQTKENHAIIQHYLTSEIGNDFMIEAGGKEIPCSLIHAESDLGITNGFSFLMSFEKPAEEMAGDKGITLVYHDRLFQNGILKFHFSKDQIRNFPSLKAI